MPKIQRMTYGSANPIPTPVTVQTKARRHQYQSGRESCS